LKKYNHGWWFFWISQSSTKKWGQSHRNVCNFSSLFVPEFTTTYYASFPFHKFGMWSINLALGVVLINVTYGKGVSGQRAKDSTGSNNDKCKWTVCEKASNFPHIRLERWVILSFMCHPSLIHVRLSSMAYYKFGNLWFKLIKCVWLGF